MRVIAITKGKKIKNPVKTTSMFIIYSNSAIFTEKEKVDTRYPCRTLVTFYN